MPEGLQLSGFGLLTMFLSALALLAVLASLRYLWSVLPVAKSTREKLQRAQPIFELGIGVLYLLLFPFVFSEQPEYASFLLGLLVLAVVGVSWFALRDFVHGLVLKTGDVIRENDQVEFDRNRGRVRQMGYRVLTIETPSGKELVVPYSQISKQTLTRTRQHASLHRHRFRIEMPVEATWTEVANTVRARAMEHHWSSFSREPEIQEAQDGRMEVGVFTLDPQHGDEIESVVRRAIARYRAREGGSQ